MRLIFLRHAQSEANISGTVSTLIPGASLTETGVIEALKVGQELSNHYSFQALYTSPFRRTMHTSELVNQSLFIPHIIPDVRLVEMYAGPYEAAPLRKMQNAWQAYVEQMHGAEYLAQLGGSGESEFSFYDRLMSFLIEIGVRHPSDTVLVVTHQAPAQALYDFCVGHSSHVILNNTTFAEVEVSPGSLEPLIQRRNHLAKALLETIPFT